MPTTWTAKTPPTSAWASGAAPSALWSPDDGFPQEIDGGAASTLLWLGVYDGGSAVAISDIVTGIGPQRTDWVPRGAP